MSSRSNSTLICREIVRDESQNIQLSKRTLDSLKLDRRYQEEKKKRDYWKCWNKLSHGSLFMHNIFNSWHGAREGWEGAVLTSYIYEKAQGWDSPQQRPLHRVRRQEAGGRNLSFSPGMGGIGSPFLSKWFKHLATFSFNSSLTWQREGRVFGFKYKAHSQGFWLCHWFAACLGKALHLFMPPVQQKANNYSTFTLPCVFLGCSVKPPGRGRIHGGWHLASDGPIQSRLCKCCWD